MSLRRTNLAPELRRAWVNPRCMVAAMSALGLVLMTLQDPLARAALDLTQICAGSSSFPVTTLMSANGVELMAGHAWHWAAMLLVMAPMLTLRFADSAHPTPVGGSPFTWARITKFAAYIFVWFVTGISFLLVGDVMRMSVPGDDSMILSVALGLAWHFSPQRQAVKRACERKTSGRRAPLPDIAEGAIHGFWCVLRCWHLMLLPMLVLHGNAELTWMGGITLAAALNSRSRNPSWGSR